MKECIKQGNNSRGGGGNSDIEPKKIPRMEGKFVKKDVLGLGDESEESEKRYMEMRVRGVVNLS